MLNHEMMNLNLKRIDMCDIRMALTSVIIGMRCEMNDPSTSETRKEVLKRSVQKWERLKAEVVRQFNEQDGD